MVENKQKMTSHQLFFKVACFIHVCVCSTGGKEETTCNILAPYNDGANIKTEQLQKLCYPNRNYNNVPGMVNVQLFGDEVAEFLQTLHHNTTKVHITVRNSYGKHIVHDLIDLTSLQYTSIEELWIIPERRNNDVGLLIGEKYNLNYTAQTTDPLALKFLHINTILKNADGLITLLNQTRCLHILDLSGINLEVKYEGDVFSELLPSLQDQPVLVLKLDQFYQARQKYFSNIDPTVMFKPLISSPLLCLTLAHNYIESVRAGISVTLPHLRIIDLSFNNVDSGKSLMEIFVFDLLYHPKIEIISLNAQGNFQSYIVVERVMQKRAFFFQITDKIKLCQGAYELAYAFFNHTYFCDFLRCLVHDINIPIFCDIFPPVQKWIPSDGSSCKWTFPIAKQITEVNMNYLNLNGKYYYRLNDPVCFGENKLKKMSFSHNAHLFSRSLEENIIDVTPFLNMHYMESVDLSFNQVKINPSKSQLIKSFRNLKYLNIQGNSIILNDANQTICETYRYLEELSIGFSDIHGLNSNTFSNCKCLEVLDLSGSGLANFSLLFDGDHVPSLKLLNLSSNLLHSIGSDSRESLTSLALKHSVTLDLSNNILTCDCSEDAAETISMVQEDDGVTFFQKDDYTCMYKDDPAAKVIHINLKVLQRDCKEYIKILTYSIPFLVVGIAATVTIMTGYMYRFKLITMCYRISHRVKSHKKGTYYKYDAFVSYCAEDRFWVHDTLMKVLEEKHGFRLCIHYRDFTVGGLVDEEIEDQMDMSRINIVIMSDMYINKKWPEIELRKAYDDYKENKKSFILIKYTEIHTPRSEMALLVKQLLDGYIFIKWPERPPGNLSDKERKILEAKQELFWYKLVSKMHGKESRPCTCCKRKHGGSDSVFLLDDCIEM